MNQIHQANGQTTRYSSEVDYAQMLNKRGEWVPSIPEPFYTLPGNKCSCGRTFLLKRSYQAHYALEHIVLGDKPL
jgi:hypothetical protein